MKPRDVIELLNPRVGDSPTEKYGPIIIVISWLGMGFSLWFLGIPESGLIREGALSFHGLIGGLALPWLRRLMN